MIKYIPESILDELEELKDLWKFDEAMRIINGVLIDDPNNEDALLQVADIQYRKWEIGKASKAIDFLNSRKNDQDPLGLYVKWILEMEKNNRKTAKEYLQKALVLTNWENHEILRCLSMVSARLYPLSGVYIPDVPMGNDAPYPNEWESDGSWISRPLLSLRYALNPV